MLKRGITLWLLVGTLWLLGGCVAPDGSVIRYQQAPDGSIVGWQVDAPAVKSVDAANVLAYQPQPILYFGEVEEEWGIVAVDTDGQSQGIVAPGVLLGWSRQGDRFAYILPDEASGVQSLVVTELDGTPLTLMQTAAGEERLTLGWSSVWSPDGSSLAVLLETETKTSLAVFAVDRQQPAQLFSLPTEAYTRDGFGYNWPPYALKWSPDGQKVLLAWEQTLVVNVTNGEIETVTPFPTMAEWLPGSDAIVYFEVMTSPELYLKPLGGGEARVVLDSKTLAEWGLGEVIFFHSPLLKLSPSGKKIAISAIQDDLSSVVLTFDVGMAESDVWDTPAQRIILNKIGVAGWDWGPDEQEMAILASSSEAGLTIDVLTLSDGTRRTLTKMGTLEGIEIDVIALLNMISWVP